MKTTMKLIKLMEGEEFDLDDYKRWIDRSASDMDVHIDSERLGPLRTREEVLEFVIATAEKQARENPEESGWADDGMVREIWIEQDSFYE